VLAAIAVLALTGGAVALLVRLDRGRAGERAAADAQAAALRAADGVRGLVANLEGQTQNATANPRLVAALDANVDQETLRDLLLTEPWWEPFRRVVDGFGLYADESTATVTSRLPAVFDARTMVRDARQGHHASPVCWWRRGRCWRNEPVALTGRSIWSGGPERIIDVGLMSGMAERAGGAVAISDGRGCWSRRRRGRQRPDDLGARAALARSPGPRSRSGPDGGGVAVQRAARAGGRAPAGSPPRRLPLPWSAIAILIIGVAFDRPLRAGGALPDARSRLVRPRARHGVARSAATPSWSASARVDGRDLRGRHAGKAPSAARSSSACVPS
jgi:hypothetical protein